jgi:hypothetical protein
MLSSGNPLRSASWARVANAKPSSPANPAGEVVYYRDSKLVAALIGAGQNVRLHLERNLAVPAHVS